MIDALLKYDQLDLHSKLGFSSHPSPEKSDCERKKQCAGADKQGCEPNQRTIRVQDSADSVTEAAHRGRGYPFHVDHDIVLFDVCLDAGGNVRDVGVHLCLEVSVGVIAKAADRKKTAGLMRSCSR